MYHLENQVFDYLKVLNKEKSSKKGILWKCQCKCGKIIYVTSTDLVKGHTTSCGCKRGESIKRVKEEKAKNKIGQKYGLLTIIDLVDNIQNTHYVYKCQCKCGKITFVDSSNWGRTYSCGCLKESKGEYLLSKILEEMNIKFEKEKIFKDCLNPKTGRYLRFDFYLPDYNCCIEYDGEQHFKEYSNWNSSSLKERQYRDNLKNLYCYNNNIKIIRIPYYDFDKINKKYLRDRIKNIC